MKIENKNAHWIKSARKDWGFVLFVDWKLYFRCMISNILSSCLVKILKIKYYWPARNNFIHKIFVEIDLNRPGKNLKWFQRIWIDSNWWTEMYSKNLTGFETIWHGFENVEERFIMDLKCNQMIGIDSKVLKYQVESIWLDFEIFSNDLDTFEMMWWDYKMFAKGRMNLLWMLNVKSIWNYLYWFSNVSKCFESIRMDLARFRNIGI